MTAPVASLCLFVAASASAQIIHDRQTVISITPTSLLTLLQDAGWAAETAEVDAEQVIIADIQSRTIILWPRACQPRDNAPCSALLAYAVLPTGSTAHQVNAFNAAFPAARATLREGYVVLDRYTYADFGIVRGSLMVELAVLARLVDDWWAFGSTRPSAQVAFTPLVPSPPAPDDEWPFSVSWMQRASVSNAP